MAADLTAAIEAAARAMSAWFWLHPDHDEKPLLDDAARAAVEAAAPLIRAQARAEVAEELRAAFTTPGARMPTWVQTGAVLRGRDIAEWAAGIAEGREHAHTSRGGVVKPLRPFEIAALDLPGRDAATRADERAKVRAELLAIAHERTHGHGELFYEGHYLTGVADRIAPAPDQPEERTT